MSGVGQLVGDVGDLGLQVAAQLGREIARIRQIILGFVFDHSLAHLPGQVEAGEFGVALLQLGDDAQRLAVVVEAAVVLHQAGEGNFP
jgi:hypothetical protein